jgi:hypothetical protein
VPEEEYRRSILLNFHKMIAKKRGKVKVTELKNELSESGQKTVNKNFIVASFLHFSLEICTLKAEIIIKRMSRIKEKFSQVDEVHFTKFLMIKNQT